MVGKATFVDETIKGERKEEAVVIKSAIRFTLASLFLSLGDGFRSYLFSVKLEEGRRRQTKRPQLPCLRDRGRVEMPHLVAPPPALKCRFAMQHVQWRYKDLWIAQMTGDTQKATNAQDYTYYVSPLMGPSFTCCSLYPQSGILHREVFMKSL
jgi:hypothetical protein